MYKSCLSSACKKKIVRGFIFALPLCNMKCQLIKKGQMVWKLKRREVNTEKGKGCSFLVPGTVYGGNCMSPQETKRIKVNACQKL